MNVYVHAERREAHQTERTAINGVGEKKEGKEVRE